MIKFNSFFNNRTNQDKVQLETFGMSEAGRNKTTNEDAFLIAEINGSGKLLAVADGFSNSFGDESSRLAVNTIQETLRFPSNWSILERLRKATEIASRKVETHFQNIHHSPSVGTTLTTVYIVENIAYIAHIGNSRAYLVRNGRVQQLTTDHTFAQVLISAGVEPSNAARKTLLQAIGVECQLEPMLAQTELLPDDYLLLCSDGLSNNLNASDITQKIAENADISIAVEQLVEMANERDGSDNITAILAHVSRTTVAAESFPAITLQPLAMRMAA